MDHRLIILWGEGGVGKTALAVQFTLNCFVEAYDSALEDAHRKQLAVDNRMCYVEVVDNAGEVVYGALRNAWQREGPCHILVYSVASRSTFDGLGALHQLIRQARGGDTIFMLVGNKSDKVAEREVTTEEGAALARQFGCDFMETSAKTAENVEQLFMTLVRALRQREDSISNANPRNNSNPPGKPSTGKTNCIVM